jgi:hypothetical protein
MKTVKPTILDEAALHVFGDREKAYDHPSRNFEATAKIWNGILAYKLNAPITAEEVALLMVGVKLARESHRHQRDNLVDAAGYIECAARCIKEDD